MYTGLGDAKYFVSLSYVTVRKEQKMERARREQDALCATASSPSLTLAGWATMCAFVMVNEAHRSLATSTYGCIYLHMVHMCNHCF
jgi:hypothetical protein